MRNLQMIAKQCECLMRIEGIDIRNVKEYKINSRAKNRWGMCSRVGKDTFVIEVNNQLLDESIEQKWLENTILHELIHTVDGCMNHGAKFKKIANILNTKHSYHISRCTSAEDIGIKRDEKEYKHKFVCEKCGCEILRRKESEFTRHPNNYRCCCGGGFKQIF